MQAISKLHAGTNARDLEIASVTVAGELRHPTQRGGSLNKKKKSRAEARLFVNLFNPIVIS
jgi:hypothetical protein